MLGLMVILTIFIHIRGEIGHSWTEGFTFTDKPFLIGHNVGLVEIRNTIQLIYLDKSNADQTQLS